MDISYNKVGRGEPLHTLERLIPGQCFKIIGGKAIYMKLDNEVKFRQGSEWSVELPADHSLCVTVGTARLFVFRNDKPIEPVYADVVITE